MVVTEVRKYMEAAVEKLTPARAQEMARSILQGQGPRKEQVQKVAQDLMDWSNQTRDKMAEMIRREVARQLKTMGVASKEDVESLKTRVRELERGRSSRAGAAAKPAGGSAPDAGPGSPKPRARRTTATSPTVPPAKTMPKTTPKTTAPKRPAGGASDEGGP